VVTRLLNETDVGSEPGQVKAVDFLPVELDSAGHRVVPPFDEADDGTLS
jgi:hypothetical protein